MNYLALPEDEFERHFNPQAAAGDRESKIAALAARSAEIRSRYRYTARYRANQRAFPHFHQVSARHQTVLDRRFDAMWVQIAPLSRAKFRTLASFFGGSRRLRR